jgi:uncharacterized DUF497 family protein
VRFQYDPTKAASNLKKHGVYFADAEGVFYDPLAIHWLDPDSEGEARFVAVGMGSVGISWLLSTRFAARRSGLYRLVTLRGTR